MALPVLKCVKRSRLRVKTANRLVQALQWCKIRRNLGVLEDFS